MCFLDVSAISLGFLLRMFPNPFANFSTKKTFHLMGTEPGQLYQMRLFISASPMLRMHFQIPCSKGDIQYSIKSQQTLTYYVVAF